MASSKPYRNIRKRWIVLPNWGKLHRVAKTEGEDTPMTRRTPTDPSATTAEYVGHVIASTSVNDSEEYAEMRNECDRCWGIQLVYVGEHREWLCGQGWVLTSWTLCRCRARELWEAAA